MYIRLLFPLTCYNIANNNPSTRWEYKKNEEKILQSIEQVFSLFSPLREKRREKKNNTKKYSNYSS